MGELCQAACRTLCAVYKAVSGRADGVPGVIGAIQTFGDLVHWHPHIHVLSSEGVFLPDRSFVALAKVATEPFLKLWEHEVFNLLLAHGKITEEVVQNPAHAGTPGNTPGSAWTKACGLKRATGKGSSG